MSTFIEHLGVLIKEGEKERGRVEQELKRHDAELVAQKVQAQARVVELVRDIPRRFQEIVDAYPNDFAYDDGGSSVASAGNVICDLVWTKRTPRRHLRIILQPDSTSILVQWLRDGKNEDYAREVDSKKFDTAYVDRLVAELISSDRWARGFYPIV